MKRIITLLILFISLHSLAQNWADSGATWHYGFNGIITQGYIEIVYLQDTLILGHDAQQLQITKRGVDFMSGGIFEGVNGNEYIFSDSDHVYILHDGQFETLYDFSAEVGDTLTHYLRGPFYISECDSIGRSIVSETGTQIINNQELRWYETTYLDGISGFSGRIYEKLGAFDYMFPTNYLCGIDEDYYGPLRCYEDDTFELYQNPDYDGECDYIYEFPTLNYFDYDPKWCGYWWFVDECSHYHQTVHYIEGDTLINDLAYKKLYSRGRYTASSNIEDCYQNTLFDYLEALVRQQGEKIFVWDAETDTDRLMYDFTLAIGDTIPAGYTPFENGYYNEVFPTDEGPFIITDIDSLYLYDNYYKRFFFSSPLFEESYYVEGIGHQLGFVWPFWMANFGAELIAYRKYGEVPIYYFQSDVSCDFAVSIEENEANGFTFQTYPNPTIDKLQLKGFEIQSIKNVKIYSISGKILMNLSPSENIDVSSLPNGMYLLEVESVDGFKDVKRFVKE